MLFRSVCNALFDALFHILPLGTDMDKVDATPARGVIEPNTTWNDLAQAKLRELIEHQPVLVQISAAKRLRDQAELEARALGQIEVQESHVQSAGRTLGLGVPA